MWVFIEKSIFHPGLEFEIEGIVIRNWRLILGFQIQGIQFDVNFNFSFFLKSISLVLLWVFDIYCSSPSFVAKLIWSRGLSDTTTWRSFFTFLVDSTQNLVIHMHIIIIYITYHTMYYKVSYIVICTMLCLLFIGNQAKPNQTKPSPIKLVWFSRGLGK